MIKTSKTKLIDFLRWSERYTKTDMLYIAKNGFWMLGGQGILLVISFFLAWFFANFIEKELYGQYKFVISIVTLLSLAALPSLGVAMASRVSQGVSVSLRKVITKKIHWGLIGSVASLAVALYYSIQGNSELSILFALSALFIPIHESFSDYQFYLQAKQDFKRQSLYRIIQRVVFVCSMIGILLFTKNIYLMVGIHLAVNGATNFFFYKRTTRVYVPPTDSTLDPELVSYGKNLSLMNVLTTFSTHVDKILLFHFVGPAQLANYFFTLTIPQEMISASGSMTHIAFPKFATKTPSEIRKTLPRKIMLYALALTVPVGLYIFSAPFIFSVLFPKYIDVVHYSQILSILVLFAPISLVWQYFYAQGSEKKLYIYTIASPLVMIGLFACLLPFWGVAGAVVALFGRNIFDLILAVYFIYTLPKHSEPPLQT